MLKGKCGVVLLWIGACVGTMAAPVGAQILAPDPQPMPFPVLASTSFTIDPQSTVTDPLFSVSEGALQLRATSAGWIEMGAYCTLPDRHWGPVSIVSGAVEISGRPSVSGLAMPAQVSLDDLPAGSTITLRLLAQAPLIVLDLNGSPHAMLDTFIEEYRWTLTGGGSPPPMVSLQ